MIFLFTGNFDDSKFPASRPAFGQLNDQPDIQDQETGQYQHGLPFSRRASTVKPNRTAIRRNIIRCMESAAWAGGFPMPRWTPQRNRAVSIRPDAVPRRAPGRCPPPRRTPPGTAAPGPAVSGTPAGAAVPDAGTGFPVPGPRLLPSGFPWSFTCPVPRGIPASVPPDIHGCGADR